MNTSNFARLKELFRRAAAGQELTIGFLGGSITQGSLSTQPGNAYAFRVYQWFVDTFPQSKFHYVNGGIGGTSSHYGVARAVTDVLMYQPDFCGGGFQRQRSGSPLPAGRLTRALSASCSHGPLTRRWCC